MAFKSRHQCRFIIVVNLRYLDAFWELAFTVCTCQGCDGVLASLQELLGDGKANRATSLCYYVSYLNCMTEPGYEMQI